MALDSEVFLPAVISRSKKLLKNQGTTENPVSKFIIPLSLSIQGEMLVLGGLKAPTISVGFDIDGPWMDMEALSISPKFREKSEGGGKGEEVYSGALHFSVTKTPRASSLFVTFD